MSGSIVKSGVVPPLVLSQLLLVGAAMAATVLASKILCVVLLIFSAIAFVYAIKKCCQHIKASRGIEISPPKQFTQIENKEDIIIEN